LAAFVSAGFVLVALLSASNALIHDSHRIPVREILLALGVAIFFSPLKLKIQRAFDRYLYREPYDYQRTIREASEALRGTIDLPALADYVTGLVGHILKPEGVAIYLLDEDEGRFERVSSAPPTRFPEVVLTSSPLVSVLLLRQELIFRDELFGTKRSPHL